MSDESVAAIARDLAYAFAKRARTRADEDSKVTAALMTALCAEVRRELQEGKANDDHHE